MNLKKAIIWTGSLRGVIRGLSIVKTLVIARILTPFQFGIFGVASLVLGFLETITETGVNVVLIQEKNDIKKFLGTAWVVSIFRGILISLFIFLFTPLISYFFNSIDSQKSLYLISLIPFIRGFINPAVVNFQKKLEFNKEFIFRSVLMIVETILTIFLSLILKNETAFIWGMIGSSLIEVVMSYFMFSDRPKFIFDLTKLKFVLSQGKWITGAKIFDYLFYHGDDIVVGRLLGLYPLGLYQQAYRISSLPITEVTETFQKVTFPFYSKIIDNQQKLRKTYTKSLLATLLLIVPFGLLLIIFPKQIITILLGSEWLEVTQLLQILALFGIIKTVANSSFPILLAYKRQDIVMVLTIVGLLGLGISILPLINYFGLIGAGLSTIVGSLMMILPSIYWIKKYIL